MTIDERLDRLTGIVEALAASVAARIIRIETLVQVLEKHEQVMILARG
jgi:hypothetical protein